MVGAPQLTSFPTDLQFSLPSTPLDALFSLHHPVLQSEYFFVRQHFGIVSSLFWTTSRAGCTKVESLTQNYPTLEIKEL